MLPLAQITKVVDVLAYAQAEANDAAKQCPAAYTDYQTAVAAAVTAQTMLATTGLAADPSWELAQVQIVRDGILAARKTWYAAGCAPPTSGGGGIEPAALQTTAPVDAGGGQAAAGFMPSSGIGTFLIVGGLVLGALAFFGKKGSGPRRGRRKASRRKAVARRASRRR